MASSAPGSSLDASVLDPVAGRSPSNAASAPVDTTQLDKLCEKALTASSSGRHVLAAAFYRYAAEEAFRLHGKTFVGTFLTLERAASLCLQLQLEGVTAAEKTALREESWALASCCLPLIHRRMDNNTMLSGRGTAVELGFFKRFTVTREAAFGDPPLPSRYLQRVGLSLGYATTLRAADRLMGQLCRRRDLEVEAFILRVVECMLPAARSLGDCILNEEYILANTIQQVLSGACTFDATFAAELRAKWTAAAMVQMCRQRGLLDTIEKAQKRQEEAMAKRRADIAEHGLKECALPSCDKREASVQQYKFCSACRSVWYCSAEHGALHWAEHKPICRATAAANEAAAGGGAGAA